MRHLILLLLLLASLLCLQAAHGADQANGLPTFADPVVSIDAARDQNQVYLLVGTKKPDKSAPVVLQLTLSQDSGKTWSTPKTIDTTGFPITPRTSRGNDVRIAALSGKAIIVWTQPGYGAMGSGSLAATISHDNGKTWAPPHVIYQASTLKEDEHGARFPAVAVTQAGFHVIWIDAKARSRALLFSNAGPDGQHWQPARTLDPEICACCWNTLKSDGANLYALYRDVCPSDMGLLTSTNHGLTWTKSTPPGGFNWTIDGCPHTGGSIAFGAPQKGPRKLFSTVWTGKDNVTGGYVLTSADNAKTWSDPTILGNAPAIAHHTSIATDNHAGLCIAYDAPTGSQSGQYAIFISTGKQDALPGLATAATQASPAGAKATHPIALGLDSGFLVFWTQQEEGKAATVQYKRIHPAQ